MVFASTCIGSIMFLFFKIAQKYKALLAQSNQRVSFSFN